MTQQLELELFQSRETGHSAAQAAADRADRELNGWTETAEALFAAYAKQSALPFLTEQARRYAEDRGLPHPPDGRAWGHVAKNCQRAGLVAPVGFGAAKSSNGSPKVLWTSIL